MIPKKYVSLPFLETTDATEDELDEGGDTREAFSRYY